MPSPQYPQCDLPVKMSMATMCAFAWPCFPVFEVETSTHLGDFGRRAEDGNMHILRHQSTQSTSKMCVCVLHTMHLISSHLIDSSAFILYHSLICCCTVPLLPRHLQGRPLIIKWEPLRISPASPKQRHSFCIAIMKEPLHLGSLHGLKKRRAPAPAWGKWRKRQLPLSRRCGHHHPPC